VGKRFGFLEIEKIRDLHDEGAFQRLIAHGASPVVVEVMRSVMRMAATFFSIHAVS